MTATSLISPRAARTRSALLAAGLSLLSDRPVDAIAIDELVAAAGVAKGSFFNHFADKRAFAQAIAEDIRTEIEARVASSNVDVADPLERLAGGMIAAAVFAIEEPKRTAILARAARGMTGMDHPLNRGVLEDIRASTTAGVLRPETARRGALFWLGCCQTVMSVVVEQHLVCDDATDLLHDMLVLGLSGLGVCTAKVAALTDSARLRERLGRSECATLRRRDDAI